MPDVIGRRHHARDRHDRGDRVFPESRGQLDEAGRADGVDAALDGALGGRPAQLLQRRRGRRGQGRAGARRAGRGQRLDSRRVVAHEDEHDRRADLPVAALRSDRHGRPTATIEWYRGPVGKNTDDLGVLASTNTTMLPRVDIIMATENMDGALINAAAAAGAKGIVIAGVGNGNMTKPALKALARAGEEGHRLRAVDARDDGRGRSQRRGERRQPRLRRVARRSIRRRRAFSCGSRCSRRATPKRDPALLRRVLSRRLLEAASGTRPLRLLATLRPMIAPDRDRWRVSRLPSGGQFRARTETRQDARGFGARFHVVRSS